MKRFIAALLTVAMCAVVLTGCGKEGADEGTGAASGQETVTAGTEASGQEDESSAEGESQSSAAGENSGGGVLRVGTNAEFPPFEYVGDDGQPDGFDIALIKAVGSRLGMEVQVENMEFDALISAIGSKIDLAIAGMTVKEERKGEVDFSDPYYEAIQFVIVPAESDLAAAAEAGTISVADLEGKTVGVQLGTTGEFTAEDIPDTTVNTYNKGVDAVNDLMNGRVDIVIIDKNPATVFTQKFEGKLVALDGALFNFATESYAIALPKDSELTAQVNQALKDLKADGTFDELVAQYIGQ